MRKVINPKKTRMKRRGQPNPLTNILNGEEQKDHILCRIIPALAS